MTTKAKRSNRTSMRKLVYKKKTRNNSEVQEEEQSRPAKQQKVSIVRRSNRKTDVIMNDSDDSIENESIEQSVHSHNNEEKDDDSEIQETEPLEIIQETNEQTTRQDDATQSISSAPHIETMIETMLHNSNTIEYQKKVKRFVFDELFQKVKFITSELFLDGPVKINVLKHIGLTDFPHAVKEVWWSKYNNLVRKTINQKRNNILGEFKKKFLGKYNIINTISSINISLTFPKN